MQTENKRKRTTGKHRPSRSGGELVDAALAQWGEWLRTVVLPVLKPEYIQDGKGVAYMPSEIVNIRSTLEPSNPTLNALLAAERGRFGLGHTVDSLIKDMPKLQQRALAGHALGLKQAEIAEVIGKKQQWVSACISRARRQLALVLYALNNVA